MSIDVFTTSANSINYNMRKGGRLKSRYGSKKTYPLLRNVLNKEIRKPLKISGVTFARNCQTRVGFNYKFRPHVKFNC